jgi:hypothetical protein
MSDAQADASGDRERPPGTTDEQMVRELVTRLSRQDRRGASVIERAAILAEGANTKSIVNWIPRPRGTTRGAGFCRRPRGACTVDAYRAGKHDNVAPRRYVLPPGVLR